MAGTQGAYGVEKKSLDDALMLMARNKPTNHARLLAIHHARIINRFSGGTVIAPWEIDQLDEEWLDVFDGLTDADRWSRSYQQFNNRLAERRREHPNYRKYLN